MEWLKKAKMDQNGDNNQNSSIEEKMEAKYIHSPAENLRARSTRVHFHEATELAFHSIDVACQTETDFDAVLKKNSIFLLILSFYN